MKTCLIVTCYNRPKYLLECLESLEAATPPDLLIFIDDNSDPKHQIMDILADNTIGCEVLYYFKDENLGIKDSLRNGFTAAFRKYKCDLAINLDSDAIVTPDFITRLKDLKSRFPQHIVSGFNCNNPKNPVLFDGPDYVHRLHCNGINMCIDKGQYERIVLPALQSQGNWDYNSTHNLPIVISKPSVVEHIGMVSSMGHSVNPDVSCDFPA